MGIYDDNEFFEQAPDEFDREYDRRGNRTRIIIK